MTDWLAVITRPSQQYRAARELQNQGATIFLPECKVNILPKHGNRQRAETQKIIPLLGRYLFCFSGLPVRTICSTRGVSNIVKHLTGEPQYIRQEEMDAFMALTAVTQDMTQDAARFWIGQRLTIKTGPFAGLTGAVSDILKGELKLELTAENSPLRNGKLPNKLGIATVRVARRNVLPSESV